MYYILYEGLKIESNEPVYCTMYILYSVQCTLYRSPITTQYTPITTHYTRIMQLIHLIHYSDASLGYART